MAKDGYLAFDSDMHIMEPHDLWQRHLPDELKARAPYGITSDNVRDLRIAFPGQETSTIDRNFAVPNRGHNFQRNQALYKEDAARGWSGRVQLEAMDREGLDVAVMFPSRGLNVLVG